MTLVSVALQNGSDSSYRPPYNYRSSDNDLFLRGEVVHTGIKYKDGSAIWTTNDGAKVLLRNMMDNHVVNSRRMCLRAISNTKVMACEMTLMRLWVSEFDKELDKRQVHQNLR